MIKDNSSDNKERISKSVLRPKSSQLMNYNNTKSYNLSLQQKKHIKPMAYLMNQTLHQECQNFVINKRPFQQVPILEHSIKINPLREYTAGATFTNQFKDKDKLVLRWSRNKPATLNALSTKSTFMSINNTQGGSVNNWKLSIKSLNRTYRFNEVPTVKEYKITNHPNCNSLNNNAVRKMKMKMNYKRLFKKSFLDNKTKQKSNKEEVARDKTGIQYNPNSLLYVVNQYLMNIDNNLFNKSHPKVDMIKKYTLLRNEMRESKNHVKDIISNLISQQRKNDEYLNKKKYMFKIKFSSSNKNQ